MFKKSIDCSDSACPEVDLHFQGSSACEAGSCPEVHLGGDKVLFRDSERPDVIVEIAPESWKSFVVGVKNGEFDL